MGFPNPYSGTQDCKWTVTVAVGKKIKIVFDKRFQLPPKQEVTCLDYVKLKSLGDPKSHFYCGTIVPPDFISTGNEIEVSFKVGANPNNYKGFSLNYTTYEEPTSTPASTNSTTSTKKITASPTNESTTGMKRLLLNSNIVLIDCKWQRYVQNCQYLTAE